MGIVTTLALDAMGSDHGPEATVGGAALLSQEADAPLVRLFGDREAIGRALDAVEHDPRRLEVVHTPHFVPMDADPRKALDEMPEASIALAARAVARGEADALVGAGHTGAVILAAARTFERLPGVNRCALGAVFPTERRRGPKADPFSLILDAGLTVEVTPEDLVGFAIMGSAYSACISRSASPRVALLANGTEPGKGTPAIAAAHQRLARLEGMHFIGNIEGVDIPKGTADVVVTDGHTGNIVLKMLEGVAETVVRLGRYAMEARWTYKAGLLLLAPAVKRLRRVTDWEQYGGAPILGFDQLCIKAHGRSSARAIRNALKVARKGVEMGLVDSIRDGLASGRPPAGP
ncbi:MAG: phosphate acyltransferase PlsX [Deltaproteobacteria bacterium]|nr:MAG: phosphate acyltransferase PlsX [Deltaproteobacteria bacterium]